MYTYLYLTDKFKMVKWLLHLLYLELEMFFDSYGYDIQNNYHELITEFIIFGLLIIVEFGSVDVCIGRCTY